MNYGKSQFYLKSYPLTPNTLKPRSFDFLHLNFYYLFFYCQIPELIFLFQPLFDPRCPSVLSELN